jgi:hypothetical protein
MDTSREPGEHRDGGGKKGFGAKIRKPLFLPASVLSVLSVVKPAS